jgi:hypothetical protein
VANADLGPLKIRHPENWPLTLPKQQGQFATIAPQAGTTNNGVGVRRSSQRCSWGEGTADEY